MTPTELRTAALQELGVVGVGKLASPEDDEIVQARYTALYDMLLAEKLVSWSISANIPDYAAIPVTWMLAFMCIGSFGVPPDKVMEITQKGALNAPGGCLAEKMLRRQLAKDYVSYPAQPDYF